MLYILLQNLPLPENESGYTELDFYLSIDPWLEEAEIENFEMGNMNSYE